MLRKRHSAEDGASSLRSAGAGWGGEAEGAAPGDGCASAYKGRNFVLSALFQVVREREGIGALQ